LIVFPVPGRYNRIVRVFFAPAEQMTIVARARFIAKGEKEFNSARVKDKNFLYCTTNDNGTSHLFLTHLKYFKAVLQIRMRHIKTSRSGGIKDNKAKMFQSKVG
jgi:hypothetical protein